MEKAKGQPPRRSWEGHKCAHAGDAEAPELLVPYQVGFEGSSPSLHHGQLLGRSGDMQGPGPGGWRHRLVLTFHSLVWM